MSVYGLSTPPTEPQHHESFNPIDLRSVIDGDHVQPSPSLLKRDDRRALFYRSMLNMIYGDSSVGKSWLLLFTIVQTITAGGRAMVLDFEDDERSFVARLRKLGARPKDIAERVMYLRPEAAMVRYELKLGWITYNRERVLELIREFRPDLLVFDSLGEAFGLDVVNENYDGEVAAYFRNVLLRFATAGPAVVMADHATKVDTDRSHSSGSKRKRAAVVASYYVSAVVPLSVETGGRLRVSCSKDRHGTYRNGEHVGDFVMRPVGDGSIFACLYAPSAKDGDGETTVSLAARRAVTVLGDETEAISQRVLIERMREKFRGRDDLLKAGIEHAVTTGRVVESSGPRNSRLYALAPMDGQE